MNKVRMSIDAKDHRCNATPFVTRGEICLRYV